VRWLRNEPDGEKAGSQDVGGSGLRKRKSGRDARGYTRARAFVRACMHMRADTRVHACVTFSAFNSLPLSLSLPRYHLVYCLPACSIFIWYIENSTVLLIAVTLERCSLFFRSCLYVPRVRTSEKNEKKNAWRKMHRGMKKNASSFLFFFSSHLLLNFLRCTRLKYV